MRAGGTFVVVFLIGLLLTGAARADWSDDYARCLSEADADDGAEACEAALASSALSTLERAETFLALARHLRRDGDRTGARSALDQSLALIPSSPATLAESAKLHHLQGDFKAALEDYSLALSLLPSEPEMLNNRAVTYVRLGELRSALRDFGDAIRLDPGDGVSWNNRANAFCEAGEIEASVSDRIQALYRGRFTAAAAQSGLRKTGFYEGPADGIWGDDSEDALRDWTKAGCPDAPRTLLR